MNPKTLARIEGLLDSPGLVDRLSDLAPSDLQSLWLEVSRRVAAARSPAELVGAWRSNRFVRPAAPPPERFLHIARTFLESLPPAVECLELSPLAPLGTCSAMAETHQHRVVSAERGCEVVADPTNVLALEAAARRRSLLAASPRSPERVSLATVHRVVRAQALEHPDHVPHFALAVCCTAGRDEGTGVFEEETLREHLSLYIRWMGEIAPQVSLRIALTNLEGEAPWMDGLSRSLEDSFENLRLELDPNREQGRAYYRNACFKIHAKFPGRDEFELGDGGLTDWTARLLSDRKERLLISGIGLERLASALG